MDNFEYKIKYAVIPGRNIYNFIGPDNTLSIWTPRKRIIRIIDKKYEKLEASVLEIGFRNPIIVNAGWYDIAKESRLPEVWWEYPELSLYCTRNGGSRLWVAQKNNLDIPCIIADYNNMFPKAEEIRSIEEIYNYYTDKPENIKLTESGIKIYNLRHIHLE